MQLICGILLKAIVYNKYQIIKIILISLASVWKEDSFILILLILEYSHSKQLCSCEYVCHQIALWKWEFVE